MNIRNRVKELRHVPASQLQPNPKNWRTHPEGQANALRGILAEIGIAGAVLAYETPEGGLMLIDGHLRAETLGNADVPVLVLDVTEEEAAVLLATIDPLAAMAEADAGKLDALLQEVQSSSEAVQQMLAELATQEGLYATPTDAANDPEAEWQGMPEFEQNAIKEEAVIVYFPDKQMKEQFSKVVGSTITQDTKFVWWPAGSKPMRQSVEHMVCENES